MLGSRGVLWWAVGCVKLEHAVSGVTEVVKGTRGHDADVARLYRYLRFADRRFPLARDEIKQLIMSLVNFAANLAAFGNGHQNELRMISGP